MPLFYWIFLSRQNSEAIASWIEIAENMLTFATEIYAIVPRDTEVMRETKHASEVRNNYYFIRSSPAVAPVVEIRSKKSLEHPAWSESTN